jgi:two-component system phosphate regulon response regulator PhoB/two-component system alkaline phosphatase synthesis response regulator PhoP
MSKTVAILDDEADIVELVSVNLKKAGFAVTGYLEANDLYRNIQKNIPSLLILDLMLPGSNGFDILKDLRKMKGLENLPIIMLTARGEEIDRVLGLELGADDYITKPFSPNELVARVKAVLRRNTHNGNNDDDGKKRIISKDMEIDLHRYEVSVNGKVIDLTSTEFKILVMLSEKPGWVYTREQILDYLWGNEKMVVDRTIDVHIRHLREKLGKKGDIIKNVRGVGYKLAE